MRTPHHPRLPWLAALAALALTSCHTSPQQAQQHVADAEQAIERGDNDYARSVVRDIVDDRNTFTSLPPSTLCRMAAMQMRLGDGDASNTDDIDLAMRCMKAACEQSLDSVRLYIAQASATDVSALTTLIRLLDVPESPDLADYPDEPDESPSPSAPSQP